MRTVPITTSATVKPDTASDPVALVLVCAWCGQPIGRVATAKRRLVSHGMCRPCLEELITVEGRALVASGRDR